MIGITNAIQTARRSKKLSLLFFLLAGPLSLQGSVINAPDASYSGTIWLGSGHQLKQIVTTGFVADGGGVTTITGSSLSSIDVKLTDGPNQFMLGSASLTYFFGYSGVAGIIPVDFDVLFSLGYPSGQTNAAHA